MLIWGGNPLKGRQESGDFRLAPIELFGNQEAIADIP